MVTLPPPQSQQQDLYRHPPYDMYSGHPQHMPYPPMPHDPHGNPQQHPQMNFSQPAPRQRTAIACRYCRRRKVSPDLFLFSSMEFTRIRSAATALTLHPTAVVRIAYVSIKNASLHRSPRRHMLSYPHTPHTLICAIQAGSLHIPMGDQSTHLRVNR